MMMNEVQKEGKEKGDLRRKGEEKREVGYERESETRMTSGDGKAKKKKDGIIDELTRIEDNIHIIVITSQEEKEQEYEHERNRT